KYYAGSVYDVPPGLGGLWIIYAFAMGSNLQPSSESAPAESDRQGLWTARLGMVAIVSLPLLAIYGYLEEAAPGVVIAFRLRLILGAMFFLGALGFLRLFILDRELQRLISLTESSYESLKMVQERIALSQKLAALGRLVSGAAHEINNPLTAIYGYSGLLADNPSLTPQERRLAYEIQQQVRLAQSAVSSMREPASISSADIRLRILLRHLLASGNKYLLTLVFLLIPGCYFLEPGSAHLLFECASSMFSIAERLISSLSFLESGLPPSVPASRSCRVHPQVP